MILSHKPTAMLGLLIAAAASHACATPEPKTAEADSVAIDPDSIMKGKENYAMFCQACHGAEDATIDSPSNLFDKKWYHGEGRNGIEQSIRNGIDAKGMPAWGQMIPTEDITALVDYIYSFQIKENASND